MAIDLSRTAASHKIEKIALKTVEEANSKVVKDIPLDLIDPHPDNGKLYSMKGIESLMSSIEKDGFIGAIEVYSKSDGRYLIYSGHRRYAAMKALGRSTIPCLIYPMEDTYTINRKLVAANINTRVLSPLEIARQLQYYEQNLQESGFSGSIKKELEETFGYSSSKIFRYRSTLKLSPLFEEWALDVKFPYDTYAGVASLPQKWQERVYELLSQEIKKDPDAWRSKAIVNLALSKVKDEIEQENQKDQPGKAPVPQKESSLVNETKNEISMDDSMESFMDDDMPDNTSETVNTEEKAAAPVTKPKSAAINTEPQDSHPTKNLSEEPTSRRTDNSEQNINDYLNKMEYELIKGNLHLSDSSKQTLTEKLEAILQIIRNL